MARAKKDGVYLNVRIETPIYKKLQEVCEEAGQLKTTVVERALAAAFRLLFQNSGYEIGKTDGEKCLDFFHARLI